MGSPEYRRRVRAQRKARSSDELEGLRRSLHPDSRKRCGKCGHSLSVDAFGRDVHTRDGLNDRCRPCVVAMKGTPSYRRDMRLRLMARLPVEVDRVCREMHPSGTKECTKCRRRCGLGSFGSLAHKRDGLHAWCKECANADGRNRRSRPAKRDPGPRECARCLTLYPRAAEGFNRLGERYWYPVCRSCCRAEYSANPELYRGYSRTRRARKRGASGSHTPKDVARIYAMQRGRCYWCDVALGPEWHVDHRMPLARGGGNGADNIVIACIPCNLRKHDKTPEEFAGVLL